MYHRAQRGRQELDLRGHGVGALRLRHEWRHRLHRQRRLRARRSGVRLRPRERALSSHAHSREGQEDKRSHRPARGRRLRNVRGIRSAGGRQRNREVDPHLPRHFRRNRAHGAGGFGALRSGNTGRTQRDPQRDHRTRPVPRTRERCASICVPLGRRTRPCKNRSTR